MNLFSANLPVFNPLKASQNCIYGFLRFLEGKKNGTFPPNGLSGWRTYPLKHQQGTFLQIHQKINHL